MKIETVDDIVNSNRAVRNKLLDLVSTLTDAEATTLAVDEKWTIEKVVEHISMVDSGAVSIAGRLISKDRSDARPNDGKAHLSEAFISGSQAASDAKLEAPEIVVPKGDRTIKESMEMLAANDTALTGIFAEIGSSDMGDAKFPHPYFGDLNVYDWLVLKGGHERRHVGQIGRILEKLRA